MLSGSSDWKWLQLQLDSSGIHRLKVSSTNKIKRHVLLQLSWFPKNQKRSFLVVESSGWNTFSSVSWTHFSRVYCQESDIWFTQTHDAAEYRNKWNYITLLTDLFAWFRLNKVLRLPSHEDDRSTVAPPVVSLSWNRLDLWPNSLLPCTLTQQPLETSVPIYTAHSHSWTLPLVKNQLLWPTASLLAICLGEELSGSKLHMNLDVPLIFVACKS